MNINHIYQGNCLEVIKSFPDNSIDAIVTDPPYDLVSVTKRFGSPNSRNTPSMNTKEGGVFARKARGFMGKEWDGTGIAFRVDLWKECLRVLKPGGHLLAFGGTRTYHRMAVAIEDAGFEVRDMLEWIYSSGFPKSLNVGKAVDKLQGNEREVVGTETTPYKVDGKAKEGVSLVGSVRGDFCKQMDENGYRINIVTKGNSKWEGFGSALKPAHEPIILARRPLECKTIVENVLKWGCGGLDIDGCRIPTSEEIKPSTMPDLRDVGRKSKEAIGIDKLSFGQVTNAKRLEYNPSTQGRFPANILCTDDALNQERKYPFIGKDNPNYKGGFYKKCEVCDNLMWVCPYQAEKKRFCSNECRSKGHSKEMMNENNPKWQGGISEEYKKDKTSKEWKEKRLEVYTRDNFTCQSCGKTETKLDAHHIIPWRISYDDSISNLISLCPSCHKTIEEQWKNVPSTERSNSRYFDIECWGEKHGLLQFPKAAGKERWSYCSICGKCFVSRDISVEKVLSARLKIKYRNLHLHDRYKDGKEDYSHIVSHPTLKPLSVMSWLVRLVSKEGDMVLDPFMGSGTTGVACKRLKRNYVGIELEPDYIKIAEARINAVVVPLL